MARSSGIQVFLIAPALMLWGLQRLLRTADPDITVAESRLSLEGSITNIEFTLPDVVVIDADDLPEIESVRRAYERTRVKILALVSSNDSEVIQRLQVAGVRAALHKRTSPSWLLRSILEVSAGGALPHDPEAPPPGTALKAPDRPASSRNQGHIEKLTRRELQYIFAVTGDSSAPLKVIADRLHVSEHTLRNHLTIIYSKLGVAGRVHLHEFAARHHLAGAESSSRPGTSLSLW